MSAHGYWVVLETGQGGGLPDTVHGPFWDQAEAETVADMQRDEAKRVGRRDRFQVGVVETEENHNG